jgi:hypothetical protein
MTATAVGFARSTLELCESARDFARTLLTPTTQHLALITGFHFRRQVDCFRDGTGAVAIVYSITFERIVDAAIRMQKIPGRPSQLSAVNRSAFKDGEPDRLDDEARHIAESLYAEDGRLNRDPLLNDSGGAAKHGDSLTR